MFFEVGFFRIVFGGLRKSAPGFWQAAVRAVLCFVRHISFATWTRQSHGRSPMSLELILCTPRAMAVMGNRNWASVRVLIRMRKKKASKCITFFGSGEENCHLALYSTIPADALEVARILFWGF